jgi:hypothetical protein
VSTAEITTKTEAIQVGKEEEVDESELRDNPYILSETLPVPPKSFVDSRQPYDPKCPPAKYFTEEMLLEPLP